jgi:hypothetical protein
LKKQAKVQPPQDDHRNIVKKLKKGTDAPKIASQQQNKPVHHKKQERNSMDEKVEYARSVYLNARGTHQKTGDKHNTRVKINGQEFIKFTKATTHQ